MSGIRPPVPYFGGKQTIADRIVQLFPPHHHYVEPYFGGGSVLLEKPPSRMETVNDLDCWLMTWWRVLRDQPEELVRVCALTPHSRAEYNRCRQESDDCDDLERARRVWVLLTQGRNRSTLASSGGWRCYIAKSTSYTSMPGYLAGYVDRMAAVAKRLHNVSLECMPAIDMITKYGQDPDALLYVDPPYLRDTRSPTNRYAREMMESPPHEELSETLHAIRASVIISGYFSPLYDQLYQDWDRVEIPAVSGNATEKHRTECLWSNREISQPTLLDELGKTV